MKGIVAMDNKNNNKRNRFYFNQRQPHRRPKMSNLSEFDLDIIKELGLDDDESTKSKQKSSFDDDADFLDDVISDYDNWEKKKPQEAKKTVNDDQTVLSDHQDDDNDEDDLNFEIHRSKYFSSNTDQTKDKPVNNDKTRFVGQDFGDQELIQAYTKNLSSYINDHDDEQVIEPKTEPTEDNNPTQSFSSKPIDELTNEKTDIITKTAQEDDDEYLITKNDSDYSFESTDQPLEEPQVDLTDLLDDDQLVQQDPTRDLPSTSEVMNAKFDEDDSSVKQIKSDLIDDQNNQFEKTSLPEELVTKKTIYHDDQLEEITDQEIIDATTPVNFEQIQETSIKVQANDLPELTSNLSELTRLAMKDVQEHYLSNISKLDQYKKQLEERSKQLDELNESLDRRQIDIELISNNIQESIKTHKQEMSLEKLNLQKEKEEIIAKANTQAEAIIKQAYEQANQYKELIEKKQSEEKNEVEKQQLTQLEEGFDHKIQQLSTKISHQLEARLVKKDQVLTQLLSQIKIMAETTHANQLRINELFLAVNNKDKEIVNLKRDIAILKASSDSLINIKTEQTREIAKKHYQDFELDNSFKDPYLEHKLNSLTRDYINLSGEVIYEPELENEPLPTKKILKTFSLSDLNQSLEEDKEILASINKHFERPIQITKTDKRINKEKVHKPSIIKRYQKPAVYDDELDDFNLTFIDQDFGDEYNSLIKKDLNQKRSSDPNKKLTTKKVQLVFDSDN
ncbi:conserved hypothetical protein [Mycoplasmoides gallisepticum str. R(low)]|uniref:Uncharacterized protein n=3 Tax=Mycoplasmoides gallisepticum TaxID=2096 RepID=Q7NBE7_MYCGA|nr:hypothetical protein [Mycoplasmoides gallisepticum]AAP56682.2 conserved hypothetical protein [Mycoplasmoides gallisepticum str. R(low)]ADC30530.1 conserved hypothetical protein [Mycoplasmoides gallisepticum str. R(high)]